jgi:predicted RNase H-like HicB family nuclease
MPDETRNVPKEFLDTRISHNQEDDTHNDPVFRALQDAPEVDEPLTQEEIESIEQSMQDIARGDTYTLEEVQKRLAKKRSGSRCIRNRRLIDRKRRPSCRLCDYSLMHAHSIIADDPLFRICPYQKHYCNTGEFSSKLPVPDQVCGYYLPYFDIKGRCEACGRGITDLSKAVWEYGAVMADTLLPHCNQQCADYIKDKEWLEADLAELPAYEWGPDGPPQGKPVRYQPGIGLIIEQPHPKDMPDVHRVSVYRKKDGHSYLAVCSTLQGCHAEGETIGIALENLQDVVANMLDLLKEDDRL